MANKANDIIRYTLATVLLIVALNAFGGGWYGMAGAEDVPIEWLHDSPFNSYFFPSLILFAMVGGVSLTAAVFTFINHRLKIKASFMAGVIMLLWIVVQLSFIGYVSWLQPAVASAGVVTIALAYYLQRTSLHA